MSSCLQRQHQGQGRQAHGNERIKPTKQTNYGTDHEISFSEWRMPGKYGTQCKVLLKDNQIYSLPCWVKGHFENVPQQCIRLTTHC